MKFGLMYNTGYHGTDPDQREEIPAFADRLGLG